MKILPGDSRDFREHVNVSDSFCEHENCEHKSMSHSFPVTIYSLLILPK
jgi:hypothetical protein